MQQETPKRSTQRALSGSLHFAVAAVLAVALGAGGATLSGAHQAPPPLVLVSFDGFRWDYPQHAATPALDRLAAGGVRAERLIPVFPSKTFPGHYSMVTGLHPGHHGIVSNNMRWPGGDGIFGLGRRDEVQNPRWWGGEPIWAVARRAGLRAAVYFWPGSEAPVAGVRPDVWFPYEESVPYEDRVDRALDWLADDPAADLVLLYFDQPNTAGHGEGPLAPATLAQVERVDAVLGRLLDGLADRSIEANVIVVSDHGMAQNSPERVIALEDYVDLAPEEVLEFGAMVQIVPLPGREDTIYAALRGAHPNMRVWKRSEIPSRLGTDDNPRLAPIVISPDAGWEVLPRRVPSGPIPGDHGQDPLHPDMHGIFFAAGPGLRAGVVVPAIQQLDIYPLAAALLGLEPPSHDGDAARVAGLLR